MTDTLAELERLLHERLGRSQRLTPDTELVADLALDSLQQIELVVELENHFAVTLDLEEAESVRTVGELIGHIERARAAS